MDEKDFARIEELFTKLSEDLTKKLDVRSEELNKKLYGGGGQ